MKIYSSLRLHNSRVFKKYARALGIGVLVACVFVNSGVAVDSDGIAPPTDRFPNFSLPAPVITSPAQDEEVLDDSRRVVFSGVAEVYTDVDVVESGMTLCSARTCDDEVCGHGVSTETATGVSVDQDSLIGSVIVAQHLYDTTRDTSSTTWRTNTSATWYTETKDDSSDEVCDFVTGDGDGDPRSGSDDRCGASAFPEQVLILVDSSTVYFFDAYARTLWKSLAISGVTSIAAQEGHVFLGTNSGVIDLDFVNDILNPGPKYTTSTSPAIVSNLVRTLDTVVSSAAEYLFLAVATPAGVTVVNVSSGTSVNKAAAGVGASFLPSGRVVYATGTNTYISEEEAQDLVSDWPVTDYTDVVQHSQWTATQVEKNAIGTDLGGVVLRESDGNVFAQRFSTTEVTMPISPETILHLNGSATDLGPAGNDLTDSTAISTTAVATNAELTALEFDGTSNYLHSSDSAYSATGDALTIGLWVRRPTAGGTGPYQKIMIKGESDSTRSYWMSAGDPYFDYGVNKDPYFFGVKTTDGERAASIHDFSIDTWQFVVGVYDGTNIKIYLDGQEVDQDLNNPGLDRVELTGDLVTNTEEFRMGWGYDDEFFEGDMALPFITTEALTQTQIQMLYANTYAWFEEDTTETLRGTSNTVSDVSCDLEREECLFLTNDDVVTRHAANGLTDSLNLGTGITDIESTYLATWSCEYTFNPSGVYTVQAQALVNDVESTVFSSERDFAIFTSGGDSDGDGFGNDIDNRITVQISTPVFSSPTESEIVMEQNVTFEGVSDTGDVGTDIHVFEASAELCTATVDANGDWSCVAALTNGTHFVTALPYIGDAPAAEAYRSAERSFTVDLGQPDAPTLNTVNTYTNTSAVTVTWTPNDARSERFFVERATDASFTQNRISSGGLPDDARSYTFNNLSDGIEYFFRVKTQSIGGIDSDWTPEQSTTVDLTAPSVGSVTAEDGAYETSGTAHFSWDSSGFADATSGVDHFEAQIATDQTFATPYYDGNNWISTDISTDVISAPYSVENGDTYYVRVRAIDQAGNISAWAVSSGTMLDATAPTSFTVDTPESPTANAAKTLHWTEAVDNESGILRYEIFQRIYDVSSGSVLVQDFSSIGTTTSQSYNVSGMQHQYLYEYKIVATNLAGLTTESNIVEIEIDTTQPSAPTFSSGENYTKTDNISFEWTAANDLPGLDSYEIHRNGLLFDSTNAGTLSFSDVASKTDGTTFEYKVRGSAAGNPGQFSEVLRVLVDKTAPISATPVLIGSTGDNGWYRSSVLVGLGASDPGTTLFDPQSTAGGGTDYKSGLMDIRYQVNGGAEMSYIDQINLLTDGTNTVTYYSTDLAGNVESAQTLTVKIDSEAPVSQFIPSIAAELQTTNGFTTEGSITYSFGSAETLSGIASTKAQVRFDENGDGSISGSDYDFVDINGGPTNEFTFGDDGQYEFRALVEDNAGNVGVSETVVIKVDRTAPSTLVAAPTTEQTQAFVVNLLPADQPAVASGVATTYYSVDGGNTWEEGTEVSSTELQFNSDGIFSLQYYSVDSLGNVESTKEMGNDSDSDGISDWFENFYGLDPDDAADASLDLDSDGLINLHEFQQATDPTDPDTDGDTILDGTEVNTDGTNPRSAADHRFILLAPKLPEKTDTVFTLYGTATPGVVVSFYLEPNGTNELLGSARADSSGRVFLEVTLEEGIHNISATFPHAGGTAIEDGITISVNSSARSPKTPNLSDNDRANPGMTSISVNNSQHGASLQVMQVVNGEALVAGAALADCNGEAEVPVTLSPEVRYIFVYDATNHLTSEMLLVDTTVYILGVVMDTNNVPLEGINVKITSTNDEQQVLTDANGGFQFSVPIQTEYSAKFWDIGYYMEEIDVSVMYSDVYLNPHLTPIDSKTIVQGENGLRREGGNGKVTFAGWKRGYWTSTDPLRPSMTYEESLAQVLAVNSGIDGQIIYITTSSGRENVFAGYKYGRLAVDDFSRLNKEVLGWTAFGLRRLDMKAAAEKHCLESQAITMDFTDVPTTSEYYRSVAKMYSLGLLSPNEDRTFLPHRPMEWAEVLEIILAERCRVSESYITLKRDELPALDWGALKNEPYSRLYYTALKYNLIDTKFDPDQPVTREDAIRLLVTAFDIEVNEGATNTSFVDVKETDSIAALLVAAKQNGMFDNFRRRLFAASRSVTREEFASWFVGAFEFKHEKPVEEEPKVEKESKGNVQRLSREIMEIDEYDALRRKQEINQKRIDRINEGYYDPTRPDIGWIQNEDTGRLPIWQQDNSWNIKRNDESWEEFRARKAKALGDLERYFSSAGLEMPDAAADETYGPTLPETLESGVQITDWSQFKKRLNETEEEFAERVQKYWEDLKRVSEEQKTEESTTESDSAFVVPQEGTMIQTEDRSWNIRRQGETEEEFAARKAAAMKELGLNEEPEEVVVSEPEETQALQDLLEEKRKRNPLWWSKDSFSNTKRANETEAEFAARKAQEEQERQLAKEKENKKQELTKTEKNTNEQATDKTDNSAQSDKKSARTDAYLPTRASIFSDYAMTTKTEETQTRMNPRALMLQSKESFVNVRQKDESVANYLDRRVKEKKAQEDLERVQTLLDDTATKTSQSSS